MRTPIFQVGTIGRVVKHWLIQRSQPCRGAVGQAGLPTPIHVIVKTLSRTALKQPCLPPHALPPKQVSIGPWREKVTSPSSPTEPHEGRVLSSAREAPLHSLQFKIGHEDAGQDPVLLANRTVIFLAAHRETLDRGRLPKPTADSGCDDKPILRE